MTICQGARASVAVCSSDNIIAVANIQYGTKLTTTCGLADTSARCCDYDGVDCMTAYAGTRLQGQCTGREVCSFGDGVSAADTSSCGISNYPFLNHYLTMEYYCLLGKFGKFLLLFELDLPKSLHFRIDFR